MTSAPFATFALVGNPNCGKTALFNALTGGRQKVANYAGVTVERKEGLADLPDGRRVRLVDLPGTYSLRARSPDEAVTRDAVLGRLRGEPAPDVILCVADATNLGLVLRLALELRSTGRPVVFVLNMIDIAERQGIAIDFEALSRGLGLPVTATVATRRRGLEALLEVAAAQAGAGKPEAGAGWREPSSAEVRDAHRRARDILRLAVQPPLRPDTLTGRLDAWLLHPVFGVAALLGLLFLMFQAVFTWAGPAQDVIEAGFGVLGAAATAVLPAGWVSGLVVDGLIAGVGSVLVFLPQILLLFLFILLLEDTGYMARAAFLMDRIMGGAGLHGRAFIPLLSSFACAVPGVMSTRVIDSRRDRLTTILTAPLMTCSARIPVYTLIISALIPDRTVGGFLSLQGLVMFGLYAAGIVSALVVAFLIRKVFWRGGSEPFMMQLPDYKRPEPANLARNLGTKAWAFISRAGRI
ncbi:MAG: ferrous iron transporter B, partial [Phenylobacterium sp.]